MIIPIPVTMQPQPGAFSIEPTTVIVADAASPQTGRPASFLQRSLSQDRRLTLKVVKARDGHRRAITLRLAKELERLGPEGYALKVTPEGTEISASSEAGLFYGVQSLRQMVGEDGKAPCATIEDAPRYKWRGFMLDSSRHFQTPEYVRKTLDRMAYLKMNVLHWHLTDDQGWRIEIKKYPKLTQVAAVRGADEPGGSGFYSQRELKQIVAYAKERHITIIPEVEMPAHTAAAMAAYPEYTCAGKPWPVGGVGLQYFIEKGYGIYCAGREETFRFIEDVLDEVMAIFDSPVIHIGGDERPEGFWSNCERCKAVMAREGFKTESELQHWFMERVARYVNSKGRRTVAWTPTIDHGVPEKQIVMDWYYGLLGEAVKRGSEGVNSFSWHTYLDYPNFKGRQKPDWMGELSLEGCYQWDPTPAGLTPEQQKRVLGTQCHLWTEFLEQEDVDEALFPRMLATAEVAWSPQERRDWADFQVRLAAVRPKMQAMGVRFAEPPGNLPGKLRLPGRVETSMKAFGSYWPECAFDGKFVRSFWTEAPPKLDDHLTVWLDQPTPLKRVTLYTGADLGYGDTLDDGVIEVSSDGERFRPMAMVKERTTTALLDGAPVRAIRVRVLGTPTKRLSIREIVVE